MAGAFYAEHLQYRLELFFWLLANTWPFFWMALWRHAASAGGLAYTPGDYARYFFYAWLAGVFNTAWSGYLLSYAIQQGYLSFQLLRPFPAFLEDMMQHLGVNLAMLPLVAVIAALALWLLPAARTPPPLLPWLAFVALYFSFEFVFGWLLGTLAFWFEKAENFYEFYSALRVFFGGLALPLIAMPAGVREALLWTPLPYSAYAPGALAAGWPLAVGKGLLVLGGWTLATSLVAWRLWRVGLRRYGAVGG